MGAATKHVFISYRRALSVDLAARVRDHLAVQNYDVFFDISSIPSGKFGELILHQIEARPLFVPILVPGCFEKATEPADWFRREIEHALETKRHVVPVVAKGFAFPTSRTGAGALPGRLGELRDYHYIEVHDRYFKAAMEALTTGLGAMPRDIDITPTPAAERATVSSLSDAAKGARPDAAGTEWILPAMLGERHSVPRSSAVLGARRPTLKKDSLSRQLPAPTLELEATPVGVGYASGRHFGWNPVEGTPGYVLQKDVAATFSQPVEIYSGGLPAFSEFDDVWATLAERVQTFYRVKATGGRRSLDSPWSNVVAVDTPKWR